METITSLLAILTGLLLRLAIPIAGTVILDLLPSQTGCSLAGGSKASTAARAKS